MRIQDLVKFAWKAMSDRKLRAALTILGIVIGPATIVALLGATQGFSNAVGAQFQKTGATSIFVNPVGRGSTITSNDLPLFQAMPGVQAVVPYWLTEGTVSQGSQSTFVQMVSANLSQMTLVLPGLQIASGSFPTANDLGGAIIGNSIAFPDVAGANNITVNQLVTMTFAGFGGFGGTSISGARTFVTRGVLSAFGQGFLINPDDSIFVSLQTGQALLHTADYSGVVVVATSSNTVSEVQTEITNQFGNTVRVTAVDSILSTINSITGSIGVLLGSIAGVSVIVAFIGIMTTMFTTVVERTKEIGVLKAIGYSSGAILSVFLVEALVTGFLGGVIGAGAGVALSYVIVSIFGRGLGFGGGGGGGFGGIPGFGGGGGGAAVVRAGTRATTTATRAAAATTTISIVPAISPELIILAVALASAVGLFAGFLPAWRASRMPPVEALRQE